MTDSLPGAAPTDAQLLDAYVAGCNAESVLTHDAELSPPNVRKGIAAAMRFALRGAALEAGPSPLNEREIEARSGFKCPGCGKQSLYRDITAVCRNLECEYVEGVRGE